MPTKDVSGLLLTELSTLKIPSRPAILSSIESEMRSKAPNFATLETTISVDVAISVSLLKIANSAFFGFGGNVRSVREALQVLGLNTVASAIAALSLRKVFSHVPNLERYWDSSARIAQLSGWLATQIHFPSRKIKPEEAYTFGLFRDCGIPVLMSMYDDYYDILDTANNEAVKPFTAVEDETLGINHAMIGAILAKEWQLPIDFQAGIEWHHSADAIHGLNSNVVPDISRYFIAIAQLSEHLFQRLSGLNKTCEWTKLGRDCLNVLGIQEEDTDKLFIGARDKNLHNEPAF